jgi:glycosyltransferase involved in cell wall biosynthesis
MGNALVSIITPVYNAEKYIKDAIESVLQQSYKNWELIVVNDGSTDNSKSIIKSNHDERIKYYEQENKGSAAARNIGLDQMKGDYFCFLDADDVLTKDSISSRINLFNSSGNLDFVDGTVLKYNETLSQVLYKWVPVSKGNPFQDLISLNGKNFLGLTWMIKRKSNFVYEMNERISHGEDLLFFLELSKKAETVYDFVHQSILRYRIHSSSAMRNTDGLIQGYRDIAQILESDPDISTKNFMMYKSKVNSILTKIYLKRGKLFQALSQRI